MDAYLTIKRKEGVVGGLYRGTVPNIGRNCIINVGETVVYDAVKVSHCSLDISISHVMIASHQDTLTSGGHMRDGIPCHLASAVVAGITATFVASPVDVVKTRFMNAPRGRYRGVLDCARQTACKEGAGAFYR